MTGDGSGAQSLSESAKHLLGHLSQLEPNWNQTGHSCLVHRVTLGQLSLELHVQGVASQVLVELPQLEQFGRVAHVLLGVVAAHTTTRTTRAGNTISHHLSLLRALQDHQFPALLRWLPVGCHRHDAVPAGLTSGHFSQRAI